MSDIESNNKEIIKELIIRKKCENCEDLVVKLVCIILVAIVYMLIMSCFVFSLIAVNCRFNKGCILSVLTRLFS